MKRITTNIKSWINLNNVEHTYTHARVNITCGTFKEIVRSGYVCSQKSSQIRFGFRKFLDASDVADVEGRHVEGRSRFRADTMAKASTLGSIVTVRRTTCWILKRILPLSHSACASGRDEKGGEGVQQAASNDCISNFHGRCHENETGC